MVIWVSVDPFLLRDGQVASDLVRRCIEVDLGFGSALEAAVTPSDFDMSFDGALFVSNTINYACHPPYERLARRICPSVEIA